MSVFIALLYVILYVNGYDMYSREYFEELMISFDKWYTNTNNPFGIGDPCILYPNHTYCDTSLPLNERVQAFSDELSINETIGMTSCWSSPIPRLGIAQFGWWVDAAHGLGQNVNFGKFPTHSATMFPQTIGSGTSFNRTLWYKMGDVISTEGRAFFNYNSTSQTFWDPNINIFRDPRWGRGQETPGEDPFVNAEYGINFVKGMQGDDDTYLKVSVTCKHFDAYSLENYNGSNRGSFNAIVSDYDLNDTYLVPFKYCVHPDHGNASGVMCSYNAVNGVPACANKELLTDILDEWDFDGYVTSDCWAVQQVMTDHHYTSTVGETINAVYEAGMNMECANFIQLNAWSQIQSGYVDFNLIKTQMFNSWKTLFRLGYFDPPSNMPWKDYDQTMVNSKYNMEVALATNQQSVILLKNLDNYLPLNKDKLKKVSIFGPNADNVQVLWGNYAGVPPFTITFLDALNSTLNGTGTEIAFNQGCGINSTSTMNFTKAMNMANDSDLVFLVMGINQTISTEGKDRYSILLPGNQNDFINNITTVNDNVIIVLVSGGCIDVSMYENNKNVKGILWAGYGGQYGGQGTMDVVFGSFNPTGMTSQTWYTEEYLYETQMINMQMRPDSQNPESYPGRGYRYYIGNNILYPFGYGLSYTTWICNNLKANDNIITVDLKNSGNVAGGAVVLVYFIPTNAGQNGLPLKRLIAFERANMVNVGDVITLTMNIFEEFYYSDAYKNMQGTFKLGGVCN